MVRFLSMGKKASEVAKRRAKKSERKKNERKKKLRKAKSNGAPGDWSRQPRLSRGPSLRAPIGFSDLMARAPHTTAMAAALEIEGDQRVGDEWDIPDDLPTLARLREMTNDDLHARLHLLTGVPVESQAFVAAAEGQTSARATADSLWLHALDSASASMETRARVAVCAAELWVRLLKRPCREHLGLLHLNILLPQEEDAHPTAASVRAAAVFWRTLLQMEPAPRSTLLQLAELVDGVDDGLVGVMFDLAEDAQWLAGDESHRALVAEAADVLLDAAQRVDADLRWDWELDHALIIATLGRREEAKARAEALRGERPQKAKGHIICGEICRTPAMLAGDPDLPAFEEAAAHFERAAACDDGEDFDAEMRLADIRADSARLTLEA